MQLVSQSTRTTIRTITVIAAFTALVFALLAPMARPALAQGNFYFAGSIWLDNEVVIDLGDPDDPDTWTGPVGQNVPVAGYEWSGRDDGQFHLSCSDPLIGTDVLIQATQELVKIEHVVIYRANAKNEKMHRLISESCPDSDPEPTDPPTEPTDPPTEPTDPPTEPTDPPTEPTDLPTEEVTEETTEAPAGVGVLDDVAVLDEVAVADDELPATGGELARLALLAALIAALGAMLLMATEVTPTIARTRD